MKTYFTTGYNVTRSEASVKREDSPILIDVIGGSLSLIQA